MQRRTFISATAAATLAGTSWAQGSDGVLRWIVPYPAGGGTDVLARAVVEAMRTSTGQNIVVDNRPGASTNIHHERPVAGIIPVEKAFKRISLPPPSTGIDQRCGCHEIVELFSFLRKFL